MANDKVQAGLLQPGVIVGDSYRVESLIGKGGMGEVWAARHVRIPNKRVAIKVLRTQGEGLSEEALKRFRREAEIVSCLEHPHIVNFFDYNFTPEGSPCMVMEFLEGESLGTKLRREGCLSLAQTRTIVRQICSALEMAHRLGIIHRDLKPDNIFLATRGHELCVKVLDFGISKFLDANTQWTTDWVVVGSLNYMSPEQALGENSQLSPQSDIFSLGSMAYQMLTGKQAFKGNDFRQVLLRLVHASPTPLNQRLPDLPLGVQRAIEKALEKKPEKRHASAMAFSEALDAADLRPPEFISNLSRKAKDAADALVGSKVAGYAKARLWLKVLSVLLVVAALSIAVVYVLPKGGEHKASTFDPLPPLAGLGRIQKFSRPAETLADAASSAALSGTTLTDAPQASDESVGLGDPGAQVAAVTPVRRLRSPRTSAAEAHAAAQTASGSRARPRVAVHPLAVERSKRGEQWSRLFIREVGKRSIDMTSKVEVEGFLEAHQGSCRNEVRCLRDLGYAMKSPYILTGGIFRTGGAGEGFYTVYATVFLVDGQEVKKVGPLKVEPVSKVNEEANVVSVYKKLLDELKLESLVPHPEVSLKRPI